MGEGDGRDSGTAPGAHESDTEKMKEGLFRQLQLTQLCLTRLPL